jgi:hypothetical protein
MSRILTTIATAAVLVALAIAGAVLPSNHNWAASSQNNPSQGSGTATTGSSIVTISLTQNGTTTSNTYALNSAGDAYSDGTNTVTFDNVVPGNTDAYYHEIKDANGNKIDHGLLYKGTSNGDGEDGKKEMLRYIQV